jgi:hypothetical protein
MPYERGTCTNILKWKPVELNSADFIGQWRRGSLYIAARMTYSRDRKDDFADIPVAILDGDDQRYLQSLDGAVLECVYDDESAGWKPLRIRTDKERPNEYRVFVSVYETIKEGISREYLEREFA